MAWIESHQELGQHPKTYRLAKIVGGNKAMAVGYLHLFWWWALSYAPDGNIGNCDIEALHDYVQWGNANVTIIDALRNAGFIDGDKIHDWHDYTWRYFSLMEKKERQKRQVKNRVKRWREKQSSCNASVTQCNAPTGPDLTIPNLTKPKEKTKSVRAPKKSFIKPTPEQVQEYATSQDYKLDAQHFWDHYEANGWKVGRNPMKDWKATVRTWMRSEYRTEAKHGSNDSESNHRIAAIYERAREVRRSQGLRKVSEATTGSVLAGIRAHAKDTPEVADPED